LLGSIFGMQHSRRDFLKYVLALTATSVQLDPMSAFAAANANKNVLMFGSKNRVFMADLAKQSIHSLFIGFTGHGFLQHPKNPSRFLVLEKWGSHGVDINFETGKAIRINSGKDFLFYGHGIFVEELKAVFTSRVSISSGKGYLTGYDPETYKIKYHYQAAPGGLHDCHRLADNTFMIASMGLRADYLGNPLHSTRIEKSALVNIDLIHGGKILRTMPADNPDAAMAHFTVTKTGKLMALSVPAADAKDQRGYVFISSDGKKPLRQMAWGEQLDAKISGEILSIALNEDHSRAAVTNPNGKVVVLIDMNEEKVIKHLDVELKGISYDPEQKKYIGTDKQMVLIDENFNDMTVFPMDNDGLGFFSSHNLYTHV
jgi:hypothetical protein